MLMMGIFSLLAACDSGIMWTDGQYVAHWVDSVENISINRKVGEGTAVGRVDKKVVALGSDDKYLVAKRLELGTGAVSYYYIEKKKDNDYLNQDEITQGPFSEKDYFDLKNRLGLPEFDKYFE